MFAATRGGGTALDPNTAFYVGSATGTTSIDLSGLGLQQGDVVVVATGWGYRSSGITTDPGVSTSGFVQASLTSHSGNGNYARLYTGYKVMGSTPDPSIALTSVSSPDGVVTNSVAHVWRGIDQSTPLAATTGTATGAEPLKANSPSISPSSPAIVLAVGLCTANAITAAPSGMGNYVLAYNDVGDAESWAAIASVYSASTYDPAAWSNSSGNDEIWIAATLALKLA